MKVNHYSTGLFVSYSVKNPIAQKYFNYFNKTSFLNEELNRTEHSPSVRIPLYNPLALSDGTHKEPMEQHALKNVNNCLNTNIYSHLETSGDKSFNLNLNVVHFFKTSVN